MVGQGTHDFLLMRVIILRSEASCDVKVHAAVVGSSADGLVLSSGLQALYSLDSYEANVMPV